VAQAHRRPSNHWPPKALAFAWVAVVGLPKTEPQTGVWGRFGAIAWLCEFTAIFTAVDEVTTVKYAVNTRRAVNTYCEVFAF